MAEERKGRLDLLVQDGLGQLCDLVDRNSQIGIRKHLQPVIDRYVSENVTRHKVPVTPVEIAEHLGILKKEKKPRGRVQA